MDYIFNGPHMANRKDGRPVWYGDKLSLDTLEGEDPFLVSHLMELVPEAPVEVPVQAPQSQPPTTQEGSA